jgi:hypothetical protein
VVDLEGATAAGPPFIARGRRTACGRLEILNFQWEREDFTRLKWHQSKDGCRFRGGSRGGDTQFLPGAECHAKIADIHKTPRRSKPQRFFLTQKSDIPHQIPMFKLVLWHVDRHKEVVFGGIPF